MAGGASTKLTIPVVRRVLTARRLGMSTKDCARYARISRASIYKWLSDADDAILEGHEGEPVFRTQTTASGVAQEVLARFDGDPRVAFKMAWEAAAGDFVAANCLCIEKAVGGGDWKAAAHRLSVYDPESYARQPVQRVETKSEVAATVDIDVSAAGLFGSATDETLAAVLRSLGVDPLTLGPPGGDDPEATG